MTKTPKSAGVLANICPNRETMDETERERLRLWNMVGRWPVPDNLMAYRRQ